MLVGYPPFFDETAYGIYEKILKGKIYWPSQVDPLSKDIIKAFLHPDRSKRLGNLIGGSQDVLDHPWFRGVDWDALERREIRVRTSPYWTVNRPRPCSLVCCYSGTHHPSRCDRR